MDPPTGTYGALVVSGLLGSLGHCLGMCGPLVAMVSLRAKGAPGIRSLPRHLLYHLMLRGLAVLGAVPTARVGSVVLW